MSNYINESISTINENDAIDWLDIILNRFQINLDMFVNKIKSELTSENIRI